MFSAWTPEIKPWGHWKMGGANGRWEGPMDQVKMEGPMDQVKMGGANGSGESQSQESHAEHNKLSTVH